MSFPKYEEYKNSGLHWMKGIPAHWEFKPIHALATLNDETLPEGTDLDYEIAYVDIGSVSLSAGIERSEAMLFGGAPSRARRVVRDGDVLVSTVRTYLKAIAPVVAPVANLVASTGFAVVRPKRGQCSGFLKYSLQSEAFVHQVIARSTGVSYPAINVSDLARIIVSAPPLPEQEAIAAFLDHETAKIDALIAEQQALLALLAEKRQATISHIVTRGLNPHARMQDTGVHWLGIVPAHWRVQSIKSLAIGPGTVFMDGDWIESRNLSEDGIRYITTGNVGVGTYKEQGSGFISDETFTQLKCTEVLPGDVLISRLNLPIGRSCVVPNLGVRIVTSVDNVILRPGPEASREFLVYRFSASDYLHEASNLASGATMQRISRSELGAMRIALPPLCEQEAMVRVLDSEIAQLDLLLAAAQRAIELLRERRSVLISGAVTGEIDVRAATPCERSHS